LVKQNYKIRQYFWRSYSKGYGNTLVDSCYRSLWSNEHTTVYTVFQKKTPTHIIGYKL